MKNGFTLIELLIVLAIIGLLISRDADDKATGKVGKVMCKDYLKLSLRDVPDNCYQYWKENQ